VPTPREKRLARERVAADFVSQNHTNLADLFEDVARDLGAELLTLPKATRRARQAAEMAHRLDQMVDLSGFSPLAEALDWFGFFLGSLAFLAIADGVAAAAKRRKKRLGNLKDKLKEDGPRLSRIAKTRLERRITRLQAKV
jgi:hypothetical protein